MGNAVRGLSCFRAVSWTGGRRCRGRSRRNALLGSARTLPRTVVSVFSGAAMGRSGSRGRRLAAADSDLDDACGGESNPPVAEPPVLPLQTAGHAHPAPVVEPGGGLHAGTDIAAPAADPLVIERAPAASGQRERGPSRKMRQDFPKAELMAPRPARQQNLLEGIR